MGLTNFPYGITSFGAPIVPVFPTQGKVFFVKPSTGSDGNNGLSPRKALKTLAKALSLCTANQNDIVFLIAESNTAGNTTDYQSSTDVGLVWNKDLVHLIGVSAPSANPRARIGWISTINNTTGTPLVTLSANGCILQNLSIFAGVNDAQAIGALKVTGQRNYIANCRISGIGHATMDVANAYDLALAGAQENVFDRCFIGLDTINRGGAAGQSTVQFTSAAARNIFKNCILEGITAHATNWKFIDASAAGSLDRYTIFDECYFINATGSTGTLLTQAFDMHASSGGQIILAGGSMIVGATDVADIDSGLVYATNAYAAATGGLAVAVTR